MAVMNRKQQKIKRGKSRQRAVVGIEPQNSNMLEYVPPSTKGKKEPKRPLKTALQPGQQASSSKKKKRLNKYIDTKLHKEEKLNLIRKLSEMKVDVSLLQSSKKLGRVKESKKELLGRVLRESRAGIHQTGHEQILFSQQTVNSSSGSEDDVTDEDPSYEAGPSPSEVAGTIFGQGLKRLLQLDQQGKPIIRKRRRVEATIFHRQAYDEDSEWEGFISDISEHEGLQNDPLTGLNRICSDEESCDSEPGSDSQDLKSRASAFKVWATQQMNEAIGHIPSVAISEVLSPSMSVIAKNFKPRPLEEEPLPVELQVKGTNSTPQNLSHVNVQRTPSMDQARLQLPIVAEEQRIMEIIRHHDIILICGATGSGKTTQVPQFLYEAGYGNMGGPNVGLIGVTQPRRVAAVSMSKRVAQELASVAAKISYQIRYESNVSDQTAIKFMTDGILLREIGQDFLLKRYSVIIIDEAHERTVNTDILIGILSRLVDLRADLAKEDEVNKPLKLIIMSATLRVSDFLENKALFKRTIPSLISIEGRQYPVKEHFARKTGYDYVDDVYTKICRGHKKLPPGGMLVFLAGQDEIWALAKRLKNTFTASQGYDVKYPSVQTSATEAPLEDEDVKFDTRSHDLADVDEEEPKIFGLDEPPEEEDEFDIDGSDYSAMKVHVLPLYSQLHVEEQMRIFKPVPEGCRMIVIATNVAETSLTIPGVRYVFDSGRVKRKIYDGKTGVQSFEVGWISKASADQRAGRAGRTGPGHCYRLYSSAVYERDFAEHEQPEILRMPIEGVVLTLKSIGLQHVVNFPFPTPPDRLALSKAEKLLTYLGAIEANGAITPAGRELALFSLHPRYGRMLLIGQAQKCTAYAIALVSALAVADLFIPESQAVPCVSRHDKSDTASDSDSDRRVRKRGNQMKIAQVREITEFDASNEVRRAYARAQKLLSANSATCDAIKYLTAICASDHATSLDLFAASHFIRLQALKETVQLRQQLARVIQVRQGSSSMPPISKLPKPDKTLLQIIPQIAAAGYIDCVAQRADLAGKGDGKYVIKKVSRATYVPYVLLFPIEADVAHSGSVNGTAGSRNNNSNSSSSHNDNEYVYCHPSSLLARSRPASLPQYVTYTHLSRPSNSSSTGADADADAVDQKPARVRMHPLAPVTAKQLVSLTAGTPLLQWSSPLSTVGRYSLGSAGAGASAGTSAGVLHPNGDHDQQQPSSTEKGEARREVWSIPSLVGPPGSLGWPLAATKIVQRKDAAIGWTYERFA